MKSPNKEGKTAPSVTSSVWTGLHIIELTERGIANQETTQTIVQPIGFFPKTKGKDLLLEKKKCYFI